MRLYIKQRVFSWNDKFVVKDEFNNDKYYGESELFAFGHKLHIYNKSKIEVAYIKERLFSFTPRFQINVMGIEVGELVKKITFFKPSYYIQNSNLTLEGNILEHNYRLLDGKKVLMKVSKGWFTFGDSYVLDISNPEDELLCLSIVLALDCESCSNENTN